MSIFSELLNGNSKKRDKRKKERQIRRLSKALRHLQSKMKKSEKRKQEKKRRRKEIIKTFYKNNKTQLSMSADNTVPSRPSSSNTVRGSPPPSRPSSSNSIIEVSPEDTPLHTPSMDRENEDVIGRKRIYSNSSDSSYMEQTHILPTTENLKTHFTRPEDYKNIKIIPCSVAVEKLTFPDNFTVSSESVPYLKVGDTFIGPAEEEDINALLGDNTGDMISEHTDYIDYEIESFSDLPEVNIANNNDIINQAMTLSGINDEVPMKGPGDRVEDVPSLPENHQNQSVIEKGDQEKSKQIKSIIKEKTFKGKNNYRNCKNKNKQSRTSAHSDTESEPLTLQRATYVAQETEEREAREVQRRKREAEYKKRTEQRRKQRELQREQESIKFLEDRNFGVLRGRSMDDRVKMNDIMMTEVWDLKEKIRQRLPEGITDVVKT